DLQLNLYGARRKRIVGPPEEWRCQRALEVHVIDPVQHVEGIPRNFDVRLAVLSPIHELLRQVHIQAEVPRSFAGVPSDARRAVVEYRIVVIIGARNDVKWHAGYHRQNRAKFNPIRQVATAHTGTSMPAVE